jgi:hypothetical protein
VRGWVCVDVWAGTASGGSFRAVAPVAVSGIGLLLRWERVGCGNVPDSAYAQGGQELGASAGACRAGSISSAQGPAVDCPPSTLVCAPD